MLHSPMTTMVSGEIFVCSALTFQSPPLQQKFFHRHIRSYPPELHQVRRTGSSIRRRQSLVRLSRYTMSWYLAQFLSPSINTEVFLRRLPMEPDLQQIRLRHQDLNTQLELSGMPEQREPQTPPVLPDSQPLHEISGPYPLLPPSQSSQPWAYSPSKDPSVSSVVMASGIRTKATQATKALKTQMKSVLGLGKRVVCFGGPGPDGILRQLNKHAQQPNNRTQLVQTNIGIMAQLQIGHFFTELVKIFVLQIEPGETNSSSLCFISSLIGIHISTYETVKIFWILKSCNLLPVEEFNFTFFHLFEIGRIFFSLFESGRISEFYAGIFKVTLESD
ncbi:unnamed protein product [Arabis nemorensis]|uniref:Uncharacterized protein n=1 Tax=Arabis nemorensis TaxID=586526 RepID=A0A565B0V4_9BRAS|nr:unnamed protein product [Arabis nemorensis]